MINIEVVEPSIKILTPVDEIKNFSKRIEKSGRVCYKSEHKITDHSSIPFVENIIKRGHESVLEHCSITCLFTISRACSHQLVRHRLASFSQESQRYVNYSKNAAIVRVIVPPSVSHDVFIPMIQKSIDAYEHLLLNKIKPEDARYVLPNCIASDIVVTANLREWRHIIKIRSDSKAQWEIQKAISELKTELERYTPWINN